MPFHAAEQHNKKQNSDLAERSDIPRRLLFISSAGKSAKGGPSERLPFLLVRFLWASKENEQTRLSKLIIIRRYGKSGCR